MNRQNSGRPTSLYLLASVVILAWGVAGFLDRKEIGPVGYYYGPNHVVMEVSEGSAGERAGIQVGDRLVSVQGTPSEELPMQSRWPQPRTGETHTLVLDRDGERITTEITYDGPTRDPEWQFAKTLIVGLAFLGFGLWSLVAVHTGYGRLVAYLCLALAYGLFQGPHLGTWDGIASHVEIAAGLLGLGLLLRFLLLFPKPKKAGLNPAVTRTLVGAFALFLVVSTVELLVHPALYNIHGIITGIFILGVVALILLSAGHSVIKLPLKAIVDSGIGLVVLGLVVSLGPPLIQMVIRLVIPDFSLPGLGESQLLLAAIPAGLALGVRKHSRMATPLP